jgi:hypothetical protein
MRPTPDPGPRRGFFVFFLVMTGGVGLGTGPKAGIIRS